MARLRVVIVLKHACRHWEALHASFRPMGKADACRSGFKIFKSSAMRGDGPLTSTGSNQENECPDVALLQK